MSFLVFKRSGETDLCHALQDFLIHLKAAGRSSSTISCYLHDLELLTGTTGNMELSHITGSHLENAIIQLGNSSLNGVMRSCKRPCSLQPLTYYFISSFFDCRRNGILPLPVRSSMPASSSLSSLLVIGM